MKVSEYMNLIKEIHEQRGDIEVVGRFGTHEIEVLEENEEFPTCLYIG
jgi:hypothetical protein